MEKYKDLKEIVLILPNFLDRLWYNEDHMLRG